MADEKETPLEHMQRLEREIIDNDPKRQEQEREAREVEQENPKGPF